MSIKHLTALLLAVATTAAIPATYAGEFVLPERPASVSSNVDAIETNARASRSESRKLNGGVAAAVAAGSHHFRYGENVPIQASFALSGFEGEHGASWAVGIPVGDEALLSLQAGSGGNESNQWSASFTFGF